MDYAFWSPLDEDLSQSFDVLFVEDSMSTYMYVLSI